MWNHFVQCLAGEGKERAGKEACFSWYVLYINGILKYEFAARNLCRYRLRMKVSGFTSR
jgi:hypothetical protein